MPTASGSIAYLGAARFQGYWNASTNNATGSGLPGSATGQFSTLLVNGGYDASTDLTASAGDYWQVTGSGTTTVDGQSLWSLNDWCIYSGSAGSSSGTWQKLAFEDTIASVIVGDLSASEVFNLTGSSNKQVLFITGASDSDVVMSGSNNFTFNYDNNSLELTGTMHISGSGVTLTGAEAGSVVITMNADQGDDANDVSTITANNTSGLTIGTAGQYIVLSSSLNAVLPGADSAHDLGRNGTHAWRKLYVDDIDLNGQGRIDFDGAATTSIRASADNVLKIEVGGSDIATIDANDLQFSGNIKLDDDKKLYFGKLPDAHIEYNQDGDNFLVISGSAAGLALSGSTVSINGNLLLSVSTLGAPSTSQDSFYVLDATDGAIKTTTIDATLGAIVADDGGLARSSSQLLISGSNIATAAVTVSADEVLMLDADGTIKRETFVDLASAMAGSGIAASSGQLTVSVGDDEKLYFGADNDAYIEYNDDGDKFLVISGSSAGVVLSGSSIALDGKLVGSNDLDTYIDISDTVNNQINLVAGGFTLGTFYGAGAKNVTINALSEDVDFKVNQDAGKALFMSGSDGIIHAHYGITLHDDNKLHFGGSNDAFVEYNEDGDNFLVISGSSAGLALSGSVVKIDGQLTLTDASSITASNGGLVASGGTLLVSGSNIADDAIDPSGDELIFLTTGSIKRESVDDFVTAIAGDPGKGLRNAGDGTLELHFAEISAVNPLASADSVMILDNGSQTKRVTMSTLGTYLAGTGLTSNFGILSASAGDNEKIYFGTDNDAFVEYNEDGDELLVISGSSAGMVLSGSTIDIGGFGNGSTITKLNGKVGVNDFDPKVVFSTTSNYQLVTFENQLSDGEGGGERLIYSPGANDTLTAGQIYFLHTDGTWDQADGSAMSTGGNQLLAVGFAGGSQQVGVLLRGFIRIPSTEILNVPGSGAVDGLPVYVSTTAGHFDFTPPSSSGEFVRVVGHAIDDDGGDVLVYFNPSPLGAANP
jgi:hypothetical protein